MAFRYMVIATVALTVGALVANGQAQNQGMMRVPVPGGRTAAGILASSTDGISRYLAPDGPIQPAITAIGTLPVRASEQLNKGITRISSGLHNQAQSLSRAAGQNGQIRMPGLDTAESHMPESFARMSQSAQNMIGRKNQFIRGQAERGIEAGNRLGQMMSKGLQGATMSVRASGPSSAMDGLMEAPAKMISSAQDFMTKSASTLQSQAKEHLNGAMQRLSSVQGMGAGVMDQAQGYSRTLQNGAQGVLGQIQQTGQELMSQLQSNHQKNMQSISGVLGSFQGSMGKMNSNMQRNMDGVAQHAQQTAQQLTSGIQKAAQDAVEAPMKVLASLQQGLSSMMMKGGGSSSGGGRY